MLFLQDKESVPEGADHSGLTENSLGILMLMTVEEQPGFCSRYVVVKGSKTQVDLVVPVVDEAWRIVGNKNVNGRERGQGLPNFELLKEALLVTNRFCI